MDNRDGPGRALRPELRPARGDRSGTSREPVIDRLVDICREGLYLDDLLSPIEVRPIDVPVNSPAVGRPAVENLAGGPPPVVRVVHVVVGLPVIRPAEMALDLPPAFTDGDSILPSYSLFDQDDS